MKSTARCPLLAKQSLAEDGPLYATSGTLSDSLGAPSLHGTEIGPRFRSW